MRNSTYLEFYFSALVAVFLQKIKNTKIKHIISITEKQLQTSNSSVSNAPCYIMRTFSLSSFSSEKSTSAFSGHRQVGSWLMVSPAVENEPCEVQVKSRWTSQFLMKMDVKLKISSDGAVSYIRTLSHSFFKIYF